MTCQLYLKAGRVPAASQGKQILKAYKVFLVVSVCLALEERAFVCFSVSNLAEVALSHNLVYRTLVQHRNFVKASLLLLFSEW